MITAKIELGHGKVGIGICTGKITGIFFEELAEVQPIGKCKSSVPALGTIIYLILPDVESIEVVEGVLQKLKTELTDEGNNNATK